MHKPEIMFFQMKNGVTFTVSIFLKLGISEIFLKYCQMRFEMFWIGMY